MIDMDARESGSENIATALDPSPILSARNLRKYFPVGGGFFGSSKQYVRSVDGVSFDVAAGETLGIVGESGCGKSTTARLLIHLLHADAGDIRIDGRSVDFSSAESVRGLRRQVQMVFQDSYATLNPRLTIEDSIVFGLRANEMSRRAAVEQARETLGMVGLSPSMFAQRYPHELSGGQRQRVNIARALALRPRLAILDEAVSALDKSVEAQVLNLLQDLKAKLKLTYLFISHDLNVVQYISDRVLVMYLGTVVEIGPVHAIYQTPRHPYTRALLASRLSMDPKRRVSNPPLTGDPPNPIQLQQGCRFRKRCPIAEKICSEKEPVLSARDGGHLVACHASSGRGLA